MNKYIIELDGKKIFTYEAEGANKSFRCRLMRPHGDRFYSAGKYWIYWTWFEAETAIEEPHIFFICPPEGLPTLEKLKNAAPQFRYAEDTAWQMSELRKFFAEYREEPLKENFHWEETSRQIIFDGGKVLNLEGLPSFTLTDDKPVEETPPPRKFRVKVYAPPVEQENLDVEQKKSEPEEISKPEDIPESAELPAELKEKISAEDLQSYIDEQTDGQCDRVSFKK